MAETPDLQAISIGPYMQTTVDYEQRCASCEQDALTVVTMSVEVDGETRIAGGWALCNGCGATPYPTMETARG